MYLHHQSAGSCEQVEGELQEIAVTKRREQGKATDLEALRELAQQRGYKHKLHVNSLADIEAIALQRMQAS
jgi:hypothetical protein